MSYDIIKGIKIKDNKVFVNCASNNVIPRTFAYWESKSLSKILKEKGQQELDIEILNEYEKGNFQAGTQNKYTRALKVLRYMLEYKKFDWRGDWDSYKENSEKYKEEYQELLLKALNTKLSKEKYIITKENPYDSNNKVYFYQRKNANFAKWYYEQAKAKVFDFKQEAKDTKKYFTNSENWQIEQI